MSATMNWNQMQRDIKREVESIGYNYLSDKAASDHKDDWYLRIVLGYRESDNTYATWLYNASSGGLHHGHYDMDQSRATEDFFARI